MLTKFHKIFIKFVVYPVVSQYQIVSIYVFFSVISVSPKVQYWQTKMFFSNPAFRWRISGDLLSIGFIKQCYVNLVLVYFIFNTTTKKIINL